ncbi:salt tolerance down-regulator-domain-containing protein [Lanmaoa asiatica]|nr:salt tolerance down-regulator-domain-containing protein [Lanmaoa asiatica]
MSYAPTTAATTTTTTTTTAANDEQPERTTRAASKAPITAHTYTHNRAHHHPSPPSSNTSVSHKPRPPAGSGPTLESQNNSKIWSTSKTEERERIKEFWLGLGEDERRDLVRVEKDTVLKKMKEQQKHSCSCAVCEKKRHAIEEELEVLYDAYYEELEQYANYQQRYVNSGGTIPPPPGSGPFPGSVELDENGAVIVHPHTKPTHHPPRSNGTPTLTNDRKPPKREFDDEGDEDDYEEEEGNPNKILTVADDLLKNDGQKFLEMMEQLAERRMQREEEAAAGVEDDSDVEEDEEDVEEHEGEEEDEDEDDDEEVRSRWWLSLLALSDLCDMKIMTEEQKMEEGKRMFSIFAARMFEQRVLEAYREKVTEEVYAHAIVGSTV